MGFRISQTVDELIEKAAEAKRASVALAQASTRQKDDALRRIAGAIRAHESAILAANTQDCSRADGRVEIDRLRLTPDRVAAMAHDVEAVAELHDPVGEEFDRATRPNGLEI